MRKLLAAEILIISIFFAFTLGFVQARPGPDSNYNVSISGGGGACSTTPTLDQSASGTTTATIPSSLSGDVVIAWVTSNGTVSAVADNSGHSSGWTLRGTATGGGSNVTEWVTTTTAAWGSTIITPTSGGTVFATQVASWSGGHTAAPFDPHAGLPVIGNVTNTVLVSTTNNISTIIGGGAATSGGGAGIGYTLLFFANFTTTEYNPVATAQTGLTVNIGGAGDIGIIGDALACGP